MFANLLIDERSERARVLHVYYSFIILLSVFLGERKQSLLEPIFVYVKDYSSQLAD